MNEYQRYERDMRIVRYSSRVQSIGLKVMLCLGILAALLTAAMYVPETNGRALVGISILLALWTLLSLNLHRIVHAACDIAHRIRYDY